MISETIDMLKRELGEAYIASSCGSGEGTAVVRSAAWRRAASLLKEGAGISVFVDLYAVDYPERDERFEIALRLRSRASGDRFCLKTGCSEEDAAIESLCDVWSCADWFEREAFDLFGVAFAGHPNLKRLLCYQGFEGHPLRKDYPKKRRADIPTPDTLMEEMETKDGMQEIKDEDDVVYLNIGPAHPAMRGGFRVLVKLSGERIVKAVPEIGYGHRCFEKEAESRPWHAVVPFAGRLNYASPIMNEVGYCVAVEKLMELRVPERANWLRMLACEVSRICDHLVCIAQTFVAMGALTDECLLLNAREGFVQWLEALSGARVTANYARIGGVARDVPAGTSTALRRCLTTLRKTMREARALIRHNRIFLDRACGVGAIGMEEALELGFTGPTLRATGCEADLRKTGDALRYGELDWDVPVGSAGDVYDRIFVRFEEIEQSSRMVEQILQRLPQGPVMVEDWSVAMPPKHEVYGTMEGMIRHFKRAMQNGSVSPGEVYACTEAANGELGFSLVADGTETPYRVKVRPPCFPLCQAFPRLAHGHQLADAAVILGSLNVVAGELDR